MVFAKRTFDDDRFEVGMHDELGLQKVAEDVPFGLTREVFKLHEPDYVRQIEVALDDLVHFALTDFAEVTFITLSHIGLVFPLYQVAG